MADEIVGFSAESDTLTFFWTRLHSLTTDFLVKGLDVCESLFNRTFKLNDDSSDGGGLRNFDIVLIASKVGLKIGTNIVKFGF